MNGDGFRLAAVGDVFLTTRSGESPFSFQVLDVLKSVDVVWLNLEIPLTEHGFAEEKAVSLRANKQQVKWLQNINQHVIASLANNHMLDCGPEGLQDTIEILRLSEIGYTGVVHLSYPQEPYWIKLNCGKLAMLSYTIGGKNISNGGISRIDKTQIIKDIAKAKQDGATWVVVGLHWGLEYTSFPSPNQQGMARAFVDAGADVILGSHPHTLQGIERYKNGIICYSLGNFNFHTSFDESYTYTDWGMIAIIQFGPKSLEFEIVPVKINADYQAELMSKSEQTEFHSYFNAISAGMSDTISSMFWLKHSSLPYFRSSFQGFQSRIKRYGWKHIVAMAKWLLHPRTYPFYWGLVLKAGELVVKK
jgi:poly-gamma-glutamate synthesis protein (capsule biosynthesis protein)